MNNGGFLSPSNVMDIYISNTIKTHKKENEQLQQENQKLKTSNTIIQEKYKIVDEINQKYKSVIEEVREYVEKSSLEVSTREYGMLTVCNSDELLQILDKAKENK